MVNWSREDVTARTAARPVLVMSTSVRASLSCTSANSSTRPALDMTTYSVETSSQFSSTFRPKLHHGVPHKRLTVTLPFTFSSRPTIRFVAHLLYNVAAQQIRNRAAFE